MINNYKIKTFGSFIRYGKYRGSTDNEAGKSFRFTGFPFNSHLYKANNTKLLTRVQILCHFIIAHKLSATLLSGFIQLHISRNITCECFCQTVGKVLPQCWQSLAIVLAKPCQSVGKTFVTLHKSKKQESFHSRDPITSEAAFSFPPLTFSSMSPASLVDCITTTSLPLKVRI